MRKIKITKAQRISVFLLLVFVAEVVLAERGSSTLPVITPSVTGTIGQNGWYTSDVTLAWSVTGSGSISKSGCDGSTVRNGPVFLDRPLIMFPG